MNVSIAIVSDTATPAAAKALAMLGDKTPLLAAAGHRVVRDTSRHVSQWGLNHPNKLGGKRTNYWAAIAAKINPADCLQVDGSAATITLGGPTMPGLMRALGPVTILPGTKTPGVKFLAIPAGSEAYGMRPGEFAEPLMVVFAGRGPVGLATRQAKTRTRDTKKGKKGSTYYVPLLIEYWLTKRADQPQDRSLLPSEEEWSRSANAGAQGWLNAELKKF